MNKKFRISVIFFALLTTTIYSQNISTGNEGHSTYYELAKDIQNIYPNINVQEAGGSIENIRKIISDSSNIDLAFVQFDVLLQEELINNQIKEKIEIVFPMYIEEVHLITRIGSNINSIYDLSGKTVAIGSESEGTNISANLILNTLQIKCKKINISYRDAFSALLHEQIDAFFYIGGVPINNLSSFPNEVKSFIKLVPVRDPKLNNIYENVTIKASSYPWLKQDINTIGVRSYIVHNKNKSNNTANLIKSISNHLEIFKHGSNYHPKWKEVNLQNQLPDWPIHTELNKIINQKTK